MPEENIHFLHEIVEFVFACIHGVTSCIGLFLRLFLQQSVARSTYHVVVLRGVMRMQRCFSYGVDVLCYTHCYSGNDCI